MRNTAHSLCEGFGLRAYKTSRDASANSSDSDFPWLTHYVDETNSVREL